MTIEKLFCLFENEVFVELCVVPEKIHYTIDIDRFVYVCLFHYIEQCIDACKFDIKIATFCGTFVLGWHVTCCRTAIMECDFTI